MSLETELRAEILSQLENVNKYNAPKVYEKIQTVGGYAEIEQRIIAMVAIDSITPSACIPQIESEL